MHLYSVFDSLAEIWHAPMTMRSDGEAQRAFMASCTRVGSPVADSPMDYSLHRIGDFDETTGAVSSEVAPIRVCSALEVLQVAKQAQQAEDERQLKLVGEQQ